MRPHRSVMLNIRFTPREQERLRRAAEAAEELPSVWARQVLMDAAAELEQPEGLSRRRPAAYREKS